jgi:5-methylcytosine-specific restriction endonuclease McrA
MISYAAVQDHPDVAEKYALPLDAIVLEAVVKTLPPDICDSLCSYGLIDEPSDLNRFMDNILSSYLKLAISAPPEFTPSLTSSRPAGCEICNREHLPLTYHHLIPRQIHAKAVKRGWHKEWELNKVAWLCRACHSFGTNSVGYNTCAV